MAVFHDKDGKDDSVLVVCLDYLGSTSVVYEYLESVCKRTTEGDSSVLEFIPIRVLHGK